MACEPVNGKFLKMFLVWLKKIHMVKTLVAMSYFHRVRIVHCAIQTSVLTDLFFCVVALSITEKRRKVC